MSTNTIIGMVNADQSVSSVYLHHDGYISHTGVILHTYYNSEKQAANIIERGAMSALNVKLIPDSNQTHSFDDPQPGVCIFYHRDRDENLEIVKNKDEADFTKEYGRGLVYLFKNDKWYINYGRDDAFIELENVLRENDLLEESNIITENEITPAPETQSEKIANKKS